MDSPFVRLGTVCKLNQRSITRHDKLDFINYLDTGSLTQNVISTIQTLRSGIDDIPARAQRKAQVGDILYSMVRPNQRHYGLLKIVPDNFVVSTGFCVISPNKDEIDAEYLYYFLTQDRVVERLQRIGEGAVSSYPAISEDDLASLQLPTLRLENQKAIAAALSCLDAKIEFNFQINAELEAFAKLLYNYWFVQYDFPDKRGQPYKSSGGKMVYSDQLKREIPSGWEVAILSETIASDKNGDWGKDQRTGNYTRQVCCVRGTDINGVNGRGACFPPVRFILDKNINKLLSSHDIIIEISGGSPTQSTGRLAIVTDETSARFAHPLICSNFCKAISLKNPKYLFNFMHLWNRLYDHGVFFGYEGKTSGLKNLLFDSFANSHWIPIPDDKTLARFYENAHALHSKKQALLLENDFLCSHRDWLLPLLMSGQVKAGA